MTPTVCKIAHEKWVRKISENDVNYASYKAWICLKFDANIIRQVQFERRQFKRLQLI